MKTRCKMCGKVFFSKKSSNRLFCSKKCFGKHSSTNLSGHNSPNWRGGRDKKICGNCGKEFFIPKSGTKRGQGKFCSIACRSAIKIGPNNPNWKGGVHPLSSSIRTSLRNRQWIKSVFERDNYTCQACGRVGYSLNAHHKVPFKNIVNEMRGLSLRCILNLESKLWDVDNGITLCHGCHKREHKK